MTERRLFPRYRARLEAQVRSTIFLLGPPPAPGRMRDHLVLAGETRDISETGLAIFVPARNIDEQYLRLAGGTFQIVLELPSGPVEIDATPVRYERVIEDGVEKGYRIGAQIKEMSDRDRVRFIEHIRSLA
jgi:hypothetical protein